MKNLKKIMAAVLVVMMISAMAVGAISSFADGVNISITRDGSYSGTGDGNTYTYYKIFDATYTSNTTSEGGIDGSGAAKLGSGTATSASYTATKAVKDALDVAGNNWFVFTPIAGSADASGTVQKYSVEWKTNSSGTQINNDASNVQSAARFIKEKLIDVNPAIVSGTEMSMNGNKWSASNVDKGYYLIVGATGENLIAATTDIDMKEKNEYPDIDKKEMDKEDASGTWADDSVNVAVGDVIDYSVTVTIPKTAQVKDKILVWDSASIGLKMVEGSLKIPNVNGATITQIDKTNKDYVEGADWCATITITDANEAGGKTAEFTFQMKVTDDAIVDTGKENETGLKYGHEDNSGTTPWNYESNPDKVEYKTYFGGIIKIDPDDDDKPLEGVEFSLKEGDDEFRVKLTSGSYYIYDASGEAKVVTNASGTIIIRGLDADKTYTLTETNNPNPGYNDLAAPVTINSGSMKLDSVVNVVYTPAEAYEAGKTYYAKVGNGYKEVTVSESDFKSGSYYTMTSSGTYNYDTENATYASMKDYLVRVENKKGSLLPSTGGIGTTIFYVVGAVLVIGSGIVLVTKKRMGKEEN